ncbi:protein kinase domain-containing protein [Candidatus Berkiella aquae]|uniref:Protein kinase n=1 Tax=Candidatus Berkiella aquae TaxID=295108 RepID=A0A0Q9YJG4_9GAMM|nr:protein kinase [Candidatus Berkiella aquae]MCS5710650.1 protein kinase [Candidatus Berkiella aquae]
MPFLKVTANEWKKAREFFARLTQKQINKDPKLSRKSQNGTEHSFVKINDRIVALANKKEGILGKGGYGLAKIAQTQDGQPYTIKIEKGTLRKANNTELMAMKQADYYHGEAARGSKNKRYTLLPYIEGTELKKLVNNKLSYTQKLIIAIKCCQAIQHDFHAKRVIHGDIKGRNFVGSIENQNIQMKAIDLGYSLVLPENTNNITYRARGTKGYTAPEILSKREYSFASDVYALGMTMRKSLRLPAILSKPMIHTQSSKRCSLEKAIATLIHKLKSRGDLQKPAIQLITTWENEQNSRQGKLKSAHVNKGKRSNAQHETAQRPSINQNTNRKFPVKLLMGSCFAILIAGCALLPLSQGLILGFTGCLLGLVVNSTHQKWSTISAKIAATATPALDQEKNEANEHPPQKHFLPHQKIVRKREMHHTHTTASTKKKTRRTIGR